MKKRLLTVFLSLALCFSSLNPMAIYADPVSAEAESDGNTESDENTESDKNIEESEPKFTSDILNMQMGIRVNGYRAFYYGSEPLTGWLSVDGITYYLDSNGRLFTGLADRDGETYCVIDGQIAYGWQVVAGAEYYFDSEGIMQKDCVIDGITLGPDGKSVYPELTVKDGMYMLSAYDTEMIACVQNSDASGTPLILGDYSDRPSQYYEITAAEDGWYKIINAYSGLAVSAGTDGANAVQKAYTGEAGQLWKFIEYKDGYYVIKSKLETVLDCQNEIVSGDILQTNQLAYTASQKWKITAVVEPEMVDIEDGIYQLIGFNTQDKVMTAVDYKTDNYIRMELNLPFGYDGEYFEITSLGNGWYSIVNVYSGMALDVVGASGKDGAAVQQRKWGGSASQMWRFINAGTNVCYIQSKTGTVLTRTGGGAEVNTLIEMSTLNMTASQIWTIGEAASPEVLNIQNLGEYLITPALEPNYVIDIKNKSKEAGANVQFERESLSASQKIRAVEVENGWYRLTDANSGKVLEIEGNAAIGANVYQNDWNGADTQLWRFLDAGDGYCYIQSKTGMVMQSVSNTVTDGTNIQVAMPNHSVVQKFKAGNTSANDYIHATVLTDYTVRITLYNPSATNIKSVSFPTWSTLDGQDDIIWAYGVKLNEKVWAVELDSKDFTGTEWYDLITHVYVNTASGSYLAGYKEYTLKAHLEGWIYVNGLRRYRLDDGSILNDVSSIFNPDSKYITVDRVKGITTIYGYNRATNSYDTPIKAMWCSVGNPISLTSAGTYKMGWQLKFKEMNASDGSYQCWASYVSQIYGAVYFHGVASDTPDLNTISANAFRNLGKPASHGCVRLAAIDARWIYYNTDTGTTIRIGDNLAAPMVPVRYEWKGGSYGPDPTYIPPS